MNKTSRRRKAMVLLASCFVAVGLCGPATVALAEEPSDPAEAAQDARTINNLRWTVTGSNTATLSWDAVAGARYYTLWVMKNGVHVQTESLQTNSYSLTITEPGAYGFAVGVAQSAGGSSSALTNARDRLFTVSLDPNNGQPSTPVAMLVEEGHRLTSAPATPVWGSNHFEGWTTAPANGALAPAYDFSGWGDQIMAPVTLTAQWQLAFPASADWSGDYTRVDWASVEGASGYEVKVRANTGSLTVNTTVGADVHSLEVGLPSAPGSYIATVRALGGRGIAPSDGRATVQLISVTYDAAGGTPASTMAFTIFKSAAPRPADPTREGYRFDGWYAAGSTTPYNFNLAVRSPLTLVAHWTLLPCKVQLHLNGGTLEGDDVTSYMPGIAQRLPAATHVGCTFGGWYDNADLEGQAVAEIPASATGDQVFWAKWDPNTYLVYLDAEGGRILDRRITHYTYGTGLILPQMVVRPDYIFEGWYTSPEGGDEVEEISETATGNMIYYAHWSADPRPNKPPVHNPPQDPGESQAPDKPQIPDEIQEPDNSQVSDVFPLPEEGTAGNEGPSRLPEQVSENDRAKRGLPATGDEGFSAVYGIGALAVMAMVVAIVALAWRTQR